MNDLYQAAKAVVVWADDLWRFADGGAELVPTLARLKEAVAAYEANQPQEG